MSARLHRSGRAWGQRRAGQIESLEARRLLAGEPLAAAAVQPVPSPWAVAVDGNDRLIVHQLTNSRIHVLDPAGAPLFQFGGEGTANGLFNQPRDLATDASNNIVVADTGAARIQRFSPTGAFLSKFGSPGTAPGQFIDPRGVAVDKSTGKIYVADAGNHRVQRFLSTGAIDTTWGGGDGVVGATSVRRDHTGFDTPSDVAVNPVNGNVYVADTGNSRLEVFNASGTYVRTYHGAYRPSRLAFDAAGNLFVGGEDPPNGDNYPAYDGRLRFLKAGDELVSRHYTGGLDDIGVFQSGLAVRTDGRAVFSDIREGRLVQTDASFAPPAGDLRVDANGGTVTFRWKTLRPAPSAVRFGSSADGSGHLLARDPAVTTDHVVTVSGLAPNSLLHYSVSLPDTVTGNERFTPMDVVNTGVAPGTHQFLRLKVAGLIYTDAQAGPGKTPRTDLAEARARFDRVADFYWRNSGFRLWPDITIVEVDKDLGVGYDVFANAEADLTAAGYGASDDFDAVWASCIPAPGNLGGSGFVFGRTVGLCEFTTQSDFVAIHEVNHTIDSIYANVGLRKYQFNHGIWAVPGGVGGDFATNGQILRNFLPANFTAVRAPFTKVMTAPDADDDGVPDASPAAGLTRPLSITEATLGGSPASADTDADGLSDLAEAVALPFHNTNLAAPDTDGDGTRDGVDRNPAYAIGDDVRKATPSVNGVIDPAEGWTVLTDHTGFSNAALVDDNNAHQHRLTTYAAWDDNYFYLALRGPLTRTEIHLDGGADNIFFGPDNYRLRLENGFAFRQVEVNVGVPDVFRQIDDDGQFSELFDTDPLFTQPYAGGPLRANPGSGLGFPGRLVTESNLLYGQVANGDSSVWEVAIPRSVKTGFAPAAGKEIALDINVAGDRLFETDHAARIRLAPPPRQPFGAAPFAVTRTAPVTVQLEDYDRGGQGVAYQDASPANTGGAYRLNEAVDIKTTTDAGGGFRLSDVFAGEWTEYTLNVAQAGAYDLAFRVSNAGAGGRFHAELDGADVTGALSVPNTGSFNTFATVTEAGVNLPAGTHVLRVAYDATAAGSGAVGGFNWVRISPATTAAPLVVPITTAAYARGGATAGTNFGAASELLVKRASTADNTREAFLKLSLADLTTIGSAKLRLNGNLSAASTTGVQLQVFKSTNTTWSETGVTFNTRPLATGAAVATFTVTGTSSAWYELDLTAFLKAEKAAGRSTVTLVLKGVANTSPYARFNSDDATSNRPQLVVTP